MATALAGIPPRPVIWKVCGTPCVKIVTPAGLSTRESSSRIGVIAVNVVSSESRVIESFVTADHVPRASCHWT